MGLNKLALNLWGKNCGCVFNNFFKITPEGFMYFGLKYWFSIDFHEIGTVVFTLVLCPHNNAHYINNKILIIIYKNGKYFNNFSAYIVFVLLIRGYFH